MGAHFEFQLPDDAPPDMAAIALLGQGLDDLRAVVVDLKRRYENLSAGGTRPGPANARLPAARLPDAGLPGAGLPGAGAPDAGAPDLVRWRDLARPSAALVWAWLTDWVGWLVGRYQLAEEIPHCWARHPPLIEELTALAAAWHDAYAEGASGDQPLVWHERLARTRLRLRDWDEPTRCRNGTHTDRRIELAWPVLWRAYARETADADLAARPSGDTAAPAQDLPAEAARGDGERP